MPKIKFELITIYVHIRTFQFMFSTCTQTELPTPQNIIWAQ